MRQIRLLDFGLVSPVRSQTVYHAIARAHTPETPDTIVLVASDRPYVCVGYHQDAEREVDLEYCAERGLPVYRREVGGGAVYLDRDQLFLQWIFQPGSLPGEVEDRFRLYAEPLVDTYRALGIDAYYRPVNDIHVDGRKIGGTGAARIGDAEVVVGSLMFGFDKAAMARVLRVPSEKMRDKVHESLERYMTTMAEQLDAPPDRDAVTRLYLDRCAAALNAEIVPGEWTAAEAAVARELDALFESDEWRFQKGPLRQTGVKIHEDVRIVEGALKAPGGLIRVTARIREGRIDDVVFSGDFTLLPASGLAAIQHAVRGLAATADAVGKRVAELYGELGIQSPGLQPDHFAQALDAAAG